VTKLNVDLILWVLSKTFTKKVFLF